jgi:FkbM family methyltransferase
MSTRFRHLPFTYAPKRLEIKGKHHLLSDMPPLADQSSLRGNTTEQIYKSNKVRTLFQLITGIRNWPDAIELRLWRKRPKLRLLEFRNGLNVVLRGGTNEWSVVHELFFADSYKRALNWLATRPEAEPYVLDLGGNIGLFSLLAAQANRRAKIVSFEPGPPNHRIYRMNMLANPEFSSRIDLREMAVAGTAGEASWSFDAENPGGSSLFGSSSEKKDIQTKVRLVSFTDCIAEAPGKIALVKMDIEGAEWDILTQTPPETWKRIQAISLELHGDPSGQRSLDDFLEAMRNLGFTVEVEAVCTYFLHR